MSLNAITRFNWFLQRLKLTFQPFQATYQITDLLQRKRDLQHLFCYLQALILNKRNKIDCHILYKYNKNFNSMNYKFVNAGWVFLVFIIYGANLYEIEKTCPIQLFDTWSKYHKLWLALVVSTSEVQDDWCYKDFVDSFSCHRLAVSSPCLNKFSNISSLGGNRACLSSWFIE